MINNGTLIHRNLMKNDGINDYFNPILFLNYMRNSVRNINTEFFKHFCIIIQSSISNCFVKGNFFRIYENPSLRGV
jgi:hypothetical protein